MLACLLVMLTGGGIAKHTCSVCYGGRLVMFVCRLHQFGVGCGLGFHGCEMSVCIRCIECCHLPLLE